MAERPFTSPLRLSSVVAFSVTAIVIFLFAGRIWLLLARFSTDPNEGWNAFQAVRAIGGGPLYPDPGSLTGNNYPPVSFFLIGWLGRVFEDEIFIGRFVSLISLMIVSTAIFVLGRKLSSGRSVGPAIATLAFLGYNATIFRSYLCMDDPQWLGHALMMVGIVAFMSAEEGRRLNSRRVGLAALLILAGGFTKQNLVGFPLAVTVWLIIYDRYALSVWLIISTVTASMAGLLLYHSYGSGFFSDVFASERHYSSMRMLVRSAGPVIAMAPLGALALRLARFRTCDRRIDLVLLLTAISLPLGIIQRGGQGVDRNAHFETLIALSLATGVLLGREGSVRHSTLLTQPTVWLLAVFLAVLPASLHADMADLLHRRDREVAWRLMQNRVAALSGRVACQTSAICYWAGKPFEIDFFLYGQYAVSHTPTALTRALKTHVFEAVELDRAPIHIPLGEVGNPLADMISRSYRPVLIDDAGRRLLTPVPDRPAIQ